jgi:hypothetical protein
MGSSTGYILNGKYVRSGTVPSQVTVPRKHVLQKQFETNEDVQRFKKDLIQPYLPNGKPNPEFIDAYPKEAERYGFVNKEEKN